MTVSISLLDAQSLDQVLWAQTQAYPDTMLESRDFFENRLALSPESCWWAYNEQGDIYGYLISYPWAGDMPPALGQALPALPARVDQWFIHDCAVMPKAQGRGVAARLLMHGLAYARRQGLRQASLVALGSALGYWRSHGYTPKQADALLANKLKAYGPQACLMHKDIAQGQD